MVLEEHVEFMRASTDPAEDIALHEIVHIGPEAINDIMVVPDVDLGHGCECLISLLPAHALPRRTTYLGNLPVGRRKRLGRVPADIVLEVIVVAFCTKLLGESIVSALLGVRDGCPGCQRAADANSIIVNLIAATEHDMEGHFGMASHHIVP